MFTGIVQGVATVAQLQDRPGLRSFTLAFTPGFCEGLVIGASIAVDGVCLTVTTLPGPDAAAFDVMQQTLRLTTLGELQPGSGINVERAARDLVDKGFTSLTYENALGAITEVSYAAWREFDPGDTMRFYALRLKEAGLVKSTPDELIARATDWSYLEQIKRELAV